MSLTDLQQLLASGSAELVYDREIGSKTLAFQNEDNAVFTSRVISGEESEVWKSCEQMLEHSVKAAAAKIAGFFGLELLSLNLIRGIKNFEPGALTQLITNHGKRLAPGERRIFPYGSFLFCLTKRIVNDWGKIDLKTYVEVYRKPRPQLDLLIKKKCAEVLDETRYAAKTKRLVISDLSHESIFRFGEEEQTARLADYLKKNSIYYKNTSLTVLFENSQNGLIDLFEQFQIER